MIIARAMSAPGSLNAIMVGTLTQPMCAPVPSLGRPGPAAWRTHIFELMSPEDRLIAAQGNDMSHRFFPAHCDAGLS